MYGHLNKKKILVVLMYLFHGIIKKNMKMKMVKKFKIKKLMIKKKQLFIKDIIIYLKKVNLIIYVNRQLNS